MSIARKGRLPAVVCVVFMLLSLTAAPMAEAAKKKKAAKVPPVPPYKASGPIPGTPLLYENLFIAENGRVTITIYNPEESGLNFSSKFAFYSGKEEILTGFTIKGFIARRHRKSYAFDMTDFDNYKQAKSMKVLGRAGRTSVE
ncbi:MAG: hypothetical protein LBO21_09245 [Synergistaceae bacterium]|nr:hypothetical protein [Synergistaceae bacterium]